MKLGAFGQFDGPELWRGPPKWWFLLGVTSCRSNNKAGVLTLDKPVLRRSGVWFYSPREPPKSSELIEPVLPASEPPKSIDPMRPPATVAVT